MSKETYLILERSHAPLKSLKENNDYILEGTFTSFDVVNENQRVYQWKEFEPHFKILQEKISRNSGLLGDADHPETPTSVTLLLVLFQLFQTTFFLLAIAFAVSITVGLKRERTFAVSISVSSVSSNALSIYQSLRAIHSIAWQSI